MATAATAAATAKSETNTQTNESVRLYYGTQEERTHFTFGLSDKFTEYAVVKSIRPIGDLKVTLNLISEDNRVHDD